MNKLLYLLMILSLVAVMSGCDESEDTSEQDSVSGYSVRMGGIFPFSGALSEKGKQRHYAALLALKHLAEAGYPVGWAVVDSQTDPASGVEAARELLDRGKVQVLIGPASSGVTKAIAEQVSIPFQVPQISYASTSPLLTQLPADEGQDFLFRTLSPDNLQGAVLAKLAYKDNGYQRVSVMYVDNAYGQGLTEVFTREFNALGGTVAATVSHPEFVVPGIGGIETYVDELQQAKLQQDIIDRPEALIVISYFRHAKVYIQEAKDQFKFHKFLFVGGSESQELVEVIKPAGALDGMCGTAPGVDKSTEPYKIFEKAYQAEYGEVVTEWNRTNAYDAVVVAGLAAYAVQAIGEEVTPLAIRENLRYVANPDGEKVGVGPKELKRAMTILDSGGTINYEGASGNVDFDEYGDVVAPIEIWCYKGGKIISRDLCELNELNQLPADITCQSIKE